MKQSLHVDLDSLSMMLTVKEGEREVRYRLTLLPDRVTCGLLREVCDGYTVIERKEERVKLGDLCADHSRNDALVWAARGYLGLPARFGLKQAQVKKDCTLPLEPESPAAL